MKLSESKEIPRTRVIITGLSGSGKSTLAAELSKRYDLIWLDLEASIDVLKRLPINQQEKINYLRIPDSATFPVATDTIMNLFKSFKGKICHEHGKWECTLCAKEGKKFDELDLQNLPASTIVVLDSATQLGNSILSYLVKDKGITYKPERDDWGGLRKYTEYMASQFQSVPFNFVCIAHAIEAELEDGKKKLVPSFGSAGMSASFASKFSHVIYCEVLNRKHKAYSDSISSNSILTKSRTGWKIEELPEPSLIPLISSYESMASERVVEAPAVVAKSQGEIASENLRAKLAAMKEAGKK